ncbi:MAG TPA: hypothetical protein PLG25_11950 [bacterium]|nr:hypothetical protein [bacterium]HMW34225.1 hypothetical protein [bacterium]HMW37286.1 hypothetical protein [bacterium]HMZ05249.1 hypothetical protein [bacterium]HND76301.1 hypothetical protein [bacterium]
MYLHRIFFVAAFLLFAVFGCYRDPGDGSPQLPPSGPRWIEANLWRMALQPDGRWGYDVTDDDHDGNSSGAEFPKNSGNYGLYAGGLMVGAYKDGAPVVLDMNWTTEFTGGRITNTTPTSVDQLEYSSEDNARTYFIGSTSHHDSPDLQSWPSDYGGPWDSLLSKPILISDLDTWASGHDLRADSLSEEAGQSSLGIEVRRMTYSKTGASWENATLIRFQVVNKSDQNYANAYLSWWVDHNLGSTVTNDAVGTDTARNLVYTYNLSPDVTSTGKQYAVGHTLLYFSSSGINSKWNSTYAYYNGNDPVGQTEKYRIQQGGINHKTGSSLDSTFAGSVGGKYVYPGDPVTGTGTLCTQGRNGRLIGNVGPFTLESGKVYDIVVAVIGGEGTDRLNAISDLRTKSDFIRNAFTTISPNMKLK